MNDTLVAEQAIIKAMLSMDVEEEENSYYYATQIIHRSDICYEDVRYIERICKNMAKEGILVYILDINGSLFRINHNPIEIIKWKKKYDSLGIL